MREGFFLIHRQMLDRDAWDNPQRTLAWIDLISMADHETGIAAASYGYLANRWHISKHTAFRWISLWVYERRIERQTERDTERDAERWFIVNYAKYQQPKERLAERDAERVTERRAEQKETTNRKQPTGNNQQEQEQLSLVEAKDSPELPSEAPAVAAAETKPHGRESVNLVLAGMQRYLGPLDGSDRGNRRFAWLLIQKAMKQSEKPEPDAAAAIVTLIQATSEHPFWGVNCRSLETLYYKANAIAAAVRSNVDKHKIVKIS